MRKIVGTFEIKDKDLAGRIGKLYTPHGVLETPALLPVIDPIRQEVPITYIESLGFKAIITNAYLLLRRARDEVEAKGIHGYLGFNGIVMTDSGAYQLLEYGHVDVDPREIVEFQKRIGSDIAVILDVPTGNARDFSQAKHSVEETLRRAIEAHEVIDSDKRVWTLPIQGGPFRELVEKSAREARRLKKYALLALGSPTILMERYEYWTLAEMIVTARFNTPITKPLHLFGAGHPALIPFAVALGVDMFDSASYILYARDNRYMTISRTYRLEELEYFPCSCPICSKYTPQELVELPKDERTKLLAQHNLHVLKQAINETKQAIKEGRLWELLEERSRSHPALARMLSTIKKYIHLIEKLTPRVKAAGIHGLFLYGPESIYHPRIVQHKMYVLERFKPRRANAKLVLIPISPHDKPFTNTRIYKNVKSIEGQNAHIVGYSLYIGIVPEELAETYPCSQFELNTEPYAETIEDAVKTIISYVAKNINNYSQIVVYYCKDEVWTLKIAEKLQAMLKVEGIFGQNYSFRVVECNQ